MADPRPCTSLAELYRPEAYRRIDRAAQAFLSATRCSVLEFMHDMDRLTRFTQGGNLYVDAIRSAAGEMAKEGLGPIVQLTKTLTTLCDDYVRFASKRAKSLRADRIVEGPLTVHSYKQIVAYAEKAKVEHERWFIVLYALNEFTKDAADATAKLDRLFTLFDKSVAGFARTCLDTAVGEFLRRPFVLQELLRDTLQLEDRLYQLIWLYRADPKVRLKGTAHPTLVKLRDLAVVHKFPKTIQLLRTCRDDLRDEIMLQLKGKVPLSSTRPVDEFEAIARVYRVFIDGGEDLDAINLAAFEDVLKKREQAVVSRRLFTELDFETQPGSDRAGRYLDLYRKAVSAESRRVLAEEIGSIVYSAAQEPESFCRVHDALNAARLCAALHKAFAEAPIDPDHRSRFSDAAQSLQSRIIHSLVFEEVDQNSNKVERLIQLLQLSTSDLTIAHDTRAESRRRVLDVVRQYGSLERFLAENLASDTRVRMAGEIRQHLKTAGLSWH
jgi:hypothetical protein